MKTFLFIFSFLLSLSAVAEYGQVDNECLRYGQNYVVKGSFQSPDPGGKTYNLDRLTSDIDKELNHFSDKPDGHKVNCLRQVFEKAKLDSSQYWADRMMKEQCSDETGLPKSKPESCSSDTWEELKKSRNNIRTNEVKYAKILDSCINNSEDGNSCDSSELQRLASSPVAKDMAKIKSEACCDPKNGAAYQVLKTFYTMEFGGDDAKIRRACKVRTMPDKDGLTVKNVAAGAFFCTGNIVLGVIESLKKLGEGIWALRNLGMVTEFLKLLTSSEGRERIASVLSSIVQAIGKQIAAQWETTTSCFNNYEKTQNVCRLAASLMTDFMLGGGASKLFKSVLIPVLQKTMSATEAASNFLKETKAGREFAKKMAPIEAAAGKVGKAVSYPITKVSQAGLAQARAIAIAAKLRMGKPFDNMLSASIKERYPTGQTAKAARSSEPPPINGQFKVAEASAGKPAISNGVASAEAKTASSVSSSASNSTASIGGSSLGSSAGKVLRTSVTTKEARSLFGHLENGLKKIKSSRLTPEWLDKNIPKNLIPEKFKNKSTLSLSEKIQAYRESLNQIIKAGTSAEKKRAGRILTQLDDLASGSSTVRRASGSVATRGSISAVESKTAAGSVDSAAKSAAEKAADLPEVKLSEVVPDPSKLSSASKPAWEELTQQISAFQKVPMDNPDASRLMQQAWSKFGASGSQQAQRAHSSIDSMLKKGEITPDGADSLHRIVATAEQTAFNESVRPQFLGTTIVTPNTNPGTFEKIAQVGKQLPKDGYNLVKNNKLGAAAYEGSVANSNGRQSEAFDDDTIKNAAVEVEKIEANFKTEKDIESYFSKLNSKEQVEDEVDKLKAQISTLLGAPGELSLEHKKELKDLMDKLEKLAQKRISELESPKKKIKK